MSSAAERSAIDRAVQVLREGGLVALPTETVYGLGADATNPVAVARIFAVKGRPADHPLIVHLADASEIDDWAQAISPLARTLANNLWPGALTLVLQRRDHVHPGLTGGQSTIALRVPAHPLTLAVLRGLGRGIAAPSANRFGRVSPTSAQHVRDDLGDEVDLILDGGPCAIGLESTIVDVSRGDDDAVVLRPGGIGPETLARLAGRPIPLRSSTEVRVSGQLASHYAPRARLVVVEPDQLKQTVRAQHSERLGIIVAGATDGQPRWTRAGTTWRVVLDPDRGEFARHLYAVLRALDAHGCTVIVATMPVAPQAVESRELVAGDDLTAAIADRLGRASAPAHGSHDGA